MTTASTSAILSQTSNANFQAWVQEIYTNWVTNCGLVQANDTGQAAVPFAGALPAGTGVGSATGFYTFTFTDSLAGGALSTTALNSGGSGYTSTSYTNLTVTGATSGATNARASLTVSGGVAGNLTITTAGSGYFVGEKLTVTGIGAGTGANWTAAALSSGSPVIFRVDFGAGAAVANPQVWITVGAGTNGSGTIAGTAGTSRMTQVACFGGNAIASTSTAYTSRYIWNSTYGYLGMSFKQGAAAAGQNYGYGAILLFRTSDSGGNPLGPVALLTNSASTTGTPNSGGGIMQCMSYSSGAGSTVYPTLSSTNSTQWLSFYPGNSSNSYIFGLTSTLENSTAFVTPVFTMDPAIRLNAYTGVCLSADFPVGNTAVFAMIGSTTLTFISVGPTFGSPNGGFAGIGSSTTLTLIMLWQ